ncbi:MAG TPA: hypothetical protein DCW90_17835 [Lachnospiraceae bacterium]|nr:hypothetical protein [Lachnospiraceae bacterium]
MIKINDVWSIAVDPYNYALQKRGSQKKNKDGSLVTDKNGNPQYLYISYGYYNTLEKALAAFARNTCRESLIDKDMTVGEALQLIDSKYNEMCELIKKLTHDI